MIRFNVFCFDEVIEGCTKQYMVSASERCGVTAVVRKSNGCSFAFNKFCFKDKFLLCY